MDSNRNNKGDIPKVSEGQEMSSSDINKLGDAIAKSGVAGSLNGINSASFGDGFSMSISNPRTNIIYPWKAFRDALGIRINLGCVFVDIPVAGGLAVNESIKSLSGGKNTWIPKSQSRVIQGYPDLEQKISYYPMGAEVWVDIKTANVLNTRQLLDPMNPYITFKGVGDDNKFKAGVYYIQMTAWSGRQLESIPYPNTQNATLAHANSDFTNWNNYSKAMKGRTVPVLKYAPEYEVAVDNPDGYVRCYDLHLSGMYYPLFTMDYEGNIYQSIKSDIYMLGYTLKPFEVSLVGNKAYVTAGTVNGIVPKMDSKYLDSSPKPSLTVSGTNGLFLLKAKKQTGKFFPQDVEVIFNSGLTIPDDTVNEGYLQIAKVENVDNGFVVTQTSTGNKLLNRTQMGASSAWWAWSS